MCFRTNILKAEIWQRGIVAYSFQVPLTTLKALQGRLQYNNLLYKITNSPKAIDEGDAITFG